MLPGPESPRPAVGAVPQQEIVMLVRRRVIQPSFAAPAPKG
jgi:hypothetical protein